MNLAMLLLLMLAALVAWAAGAHGLGLGFACVMLILLLAIASSPWLKLSMHVACAMLASACAWFVTPGAAISGMALTCAIGWSRLALDRHDLAEVAAGAGAGAAAGLLLTCGRAFI